MKRSHGTGRLYVKWGAYFGRWRTPDGRYLNRRIGKVRERGAKDGITRRDAERAMRKLMEAEARPRAPEVVQRSKTVDELVDILRQRLAIEGSRRSYLENCESMQRNHVSPAFGTRTVDSIDRHDIERLVMAMLRRGLAPKTVRRDEFPALRLRIG